jgi:SAM-dependent methyltransferase
MTQSVNADLDYLARTAVAAASLKRATFAAMTGPDYRRILDVGCGPGADVVSLASGSTSTVVGLDVSPAMLTAAKNSLVGAREGCVLVQADAGHLPFADGAFDGVRADRVLQHCFDPEACVAEFARVVRVGGRIVLVDTDWASLSIASPDPETERRLVRVLIEHVAEQPTAGRDLPHYAAAASLQLRAVESTLMATADLALLRLAAHLDLVERVAVETGAVDPNRIDRWRAGLEAWARHGTLHATLVMNTVVAERSPARGQSAPLTRKLS